MNILVTGAAGFIGYHLTRSLLEKGNAVWGVDSLNDYYDVRLKQARLTALGIDRPEMEYGREQSSRTYSAFRFVRLKIEDRHAMAELFARIRFDAVVNLAAQAGVRYSLENPYAYIDSNVTGFVNLLECCRRYPVRHLIYASSSSVYGDNEKIPFSEQDTVNDPVSLYAATKLADELTAKVYARLYRIPSTGLRFFTVYGPWGRPDMAPMLFSKAIMNDDPICVFGYGDMARDFTYIDDIVEGIVRLLPEAPEGRIPTEIFNIGCGSPINLMEFIRTLEKSLGRKARLELAPMQPGDVRTTFADTEKLRLKTGYTPRTTLQKGIEQFAAWYISPKNPLYSQVKQLAHE